MASVNKVILIGNLGADPEEKTFGSGKNLTKIRLATTESWNSEGQTRERTEWHNVTIFGRMAEVCMKYLKKGRMVYVEGRIQTRSWDKDDGTKGYMTEIVASSVKFLSKAEPKTESPYGSLYAPPDTDEDVPF